jgi:hypothetical protein
MTEQDHLHKPGAKKEEKGVTDPITGTPLMTYGPQSRLHLPKVPFCPSSSTLGTPGPWGQSRPKLQAGFVGELALAPGEQARVV